MHLLQCYVAYHESSTHLGKPLHISSTHPLISPLYDFFFPSIDARSVEFHETHHNRRTSNFGITPWIEVLFLGGAEFQKDILRDAALPVAAAAAKAKAT